jgi:hypothetical protein
MAMEPAIVSLEATDMDWFRLVRFVEKSGTPLWLEAGGEVRGVLLPPAQARRLFGQLMELGCNLDTEGIGRATSGRCPKQ